MHATSIKFNPIASTLASGAYTCALVPSDDVAAANLLPVFSTLINYSTAALATIWKPMVYKFAGNILNRLGSYLIESADDSTSSPGVLYIAKT